MASLDNSPSSSLLVSDDRKISSWTFVILYILTMLILFSTVYYSRDFVRYGDFNAVEHRVDHLESKMTEVAVLLKLSYPERERIFQHSGRHSLLLNDDNINPKRENETNNK